MAIFTLFTYIAWCLLTHHQRSKAISCFQNMIVKIGNTKIWHTIDAWDKFLLLKATQYHHPMIDLWVGLITNCFFWIPLYIWLYFFIRKNLTWYGILLFILALLIADQSSASLLKPLFKRYRPCYAGYGMGTMIGTHQGLYGFPSSHASNTFAFAMLFWSTFRNKYKAAYLFFIWASIVSYGRIYEGVHYPLDIIGGAILGSCIGLLIYQLSKKQTKKREEII